jgi:pyruvate, water dikinase
MRARSPFTAEEFDYCYQQILDASAPIRRSTDIKRRGGPMEDIYEGDWDPNAHWSTANISEAAPGVLTPLCWSVWRSSQEVGLRRVLHSMGVFEESRTGEPADPHERFVGVFAGRAAAKIEFLGEIGDRMPGTSGAAVAEQFLGTLPADFKSQPTRRRLPAIAARLPMIYATGPRLVRELLRQSTERWSRAVSSPAPTSLLEARRAFKNATDWFGHCYEVHSIVTLVNVQPAYDGVMRLAASVGKDELAGRVFAGQGSHAELEVVDDLWALSRDQLTLDEFLTRHGYHGPAEGELISKVWREDPRPVHALCAQFRQAPDSDSPRAQQRRLAGEAAAAKRALLASVPRSRRPGARLVLASADRYMGLRGVGKVAFVQALDICRLAGRHAGPLLVEAGVVADAEDVFYLSADELMVAGEGMSFGDLIVARKARRAELQEFELPNVWRGRPDVKRRATDTSERAVGETLQGTGASPGVVEAPVRVVTDPTFAEVEPGEILVTPITDPAWAPIMFVSAAIVVDVGGLFSHASVVARELAIPCVMGTGNGTDRLRTGDVCRVDGDAGTVEIIRLAADSEPAVVS